MKFNFILNNGESIYPRDEEDIFEYISNDYSLELGEELSIIFNNAMNERSQREEALEYELDRSEEELCAQNSNLAEIQEICEDILSWERIEKKKLINSIKSILNLSKNW